MSPIRRCTPLSSSPSLTSPTFWRESRSTRSTPRTSFDTAPISPSAQKFHSQPPVPIITKKSMNSSGFGNISPTANRFNLSSQDVRQQVPEGEDLSRVSNAVGTGLMKGLGKEIELHETAPPSFPQGFDDEDNTPYSGPNIWPSAEGIHVRISKTNSEETSTLINKLIGPGQRFQGVDEDGGERMSEWTLLRWEVLEGFLLDAKNTEHLDDGDILKRVGRWLRGQAALRAQKAMSSTPSSQT